MASSSVQPIKSEAATAPATESDLVLNSNGTDSLAAPIPEDVTVATASPIAEQTTVASTSSVSSNERSKPTIKNPLILKKAVEEAVRHNQEVDEKQRLRQPEAGSRETKTLFFEDCSESISKNNEVKIGKSVKDKKPPTKFSFIVDDSAYSKEPNVERQGSPQQGIYDWLSH